MIENRVFVVFADDWGRYPSTVQHIMKQFLHQNTFVWVGSLGLRKPTISIKDLKRICEKFLSMFQTKKITISTPNVYLLNPFIIPFHNLSIVRKFNTNTIVKLLEKKLDQLDLGRPIIITTQPIIGDILTKLNETSSHYLCQDDYTMFDGAFKIIDLLEREMLKKISTCHAVSKHLLDTRIPASNRIFYLPQGVNCDHFKFVKKKNDKVVIGFFGLISKEWIDLELIKQSAINYPNYEFVLIGRTTFNLSEFAGFTNLKYLGEVSYNDLPKVAENFSVGLIPFNISGLTISCNPLKLLEYFALGIPVVSTDLPAVHNFEQNMFIAKNSTEFVQLIEKAVADNNVEKNLKRRKVAELYSWKEIAENISKEIINFEIHK